MLYSFQEAPAEKQLLEAGNILQPLLPSKQGTLFFIWILLK